MRRSSEKRGVSRPIALLLAVTVLAAGAVPRAAIAQTSGTRACAPHGPVVVTAGRLELPENMSLRSARFTFDVDVGSDGRVRDIRVVDGSNDRVVDALAREAVLKSTFRAAEAGCVAVSDAYRLSYRAGDAADAPAGPPTMPPAPRSDCLPLVVVFANPPPHAAGRRGTAVVAVPLDAAAARRGEPVLQRRSGDAALDDAALATARSAQFNFMRDEGCRPQPFSYFLELTFR